VIIKSQGQSYEPASKGLHRAVCAEVYDRGIVDGKFGKKHKGWFVFQVEETVSDAESDFYGQRKEVRVSFNATLDPRGTLRQVLESWRGSPLTPEEEGTFDTDRLVGVSAILFIDSHSDPKKDKSGRVFANVKAVLPPIGTNGVQGDAFTLEPLNYVPIAERGTDFPTDPDDDEPAAPDPTTAPASTATVAAPAGAQTKAPF
jgi:hypothetical protein